MAEGKTIYHAGDTALFSDMKLIGELHQPDLAFLPIGDNYTMGPEDALIAAEWLRAKRVIPIHYNTFPLLKQDGGAFVKKLSEKGIQGVELMPGQSYTVE
jgi:L-ascorbate metabolism protein UlaG (beta-lactamase superfamily)